MQHPVSNINHQLLGAEQPCPAYSPDDGCVCVLAGAGNDAQPEIQEQYKD